MTNLSEKLVVDLDKVTGVMLYIKHFSAIIKTIADLESGDGANSRPVQLQRSSQGPLNESEVLHQPSRRRTPQSVLYNDFVKEELQRLLRRSKAHADAALVNDEDDDRTRHRSWLSSINVDSGAWLLAGAAPKMFEMSNSEFVSAICRRNAVEDPTIPKYTA